MPRNKTRLNTPILAPIPAKPLRTSAKRALRRPGTHAHKLGLTVLLGHPLRGFTVAADGDLDGAGPVLRRGRAACLRVSRGDDDVALAVAEGVHGFDYVSVLAQADVAVGRGGYFGRGEEGEQEGWDGEFHLVWDWMEGLVWVGVDGWYARVSRTS